MFFKVARQDAKYQAAFVMRKHLALPISISTLMNLFQATIQQKKHAYKVFNSTNCQILNINLHLYNAFSNKTKLEKIDYYAECVKYLSSTMKIGDYTDNKKHYLHPIVEAKAYIKSKIIGKWDKYTIKISLPNKRMVLTGNKSEIVIAMDKYYVRAAKDTSKQSIVLETIMDQTHPAEIRIAFEEHFYNELKKILQDLSWQAEKDRFNKILCDSSGEIRSFVEQKTKLAPSGFISDKVMDRFSDFKKRFLPTIGQPKLNKRFIINQGSKRLYIIKDIYYYQEFFFLSKDELIKAWKLPIDSWNANVKQFSLIQTDEESNVDVIYEKYRLKDKLYDNIFLREDISTQEEGRILSQGLKNNYRVNQNTLPLDFDYSFARIMPISQSQCKLCLQFDVQFHHKNQYEIMSIFVNEISKIYQFYMNYQKQPKLPDIHYETSELEIQLNSNHINIQKPFSEQNKPLFNSSFDQSIVDLTKYETKTSAPIKTTSQISIADNVNISQNHSLSSQSNIDDSYIKHHFNFQPQVRQNNQKKLDKVHYLWTDWEKIESGGIICINDKIVSEQKKIFKHIIASFGKNLFKMGSIMNISLPVGIFKKESHLNTYAKNLSYAPILLEPRQDQSALQRMKLITTFIITIGTVGISMEKPFNPVLGQTFQGWIDGCPIYLQQVSHHPPRSSYILYGRGYKIYGQMQPKVQLGMNSVKGYSDKQNIIQFDDGNKYSFSMPKLVIKGMLFGDRQFNFQDKNYIYDLKNHIFSQVVFGPRRGGGFFTKAQDPSDFVFGKIIKVSPNFYTNWKDKRKIFPQKADIIQELSQFEGVWNDRLDFDGKTQFNFKTQLPCRLDHEKYCLLSNSTFRKDIQKLIEQNVEQSQIQKQKLQQFQRRDRRLREAHNKK